MTSEPSEYESMLTEYVDWFLSLTIDEQKLLVALVEDSQPKPASPFDRLNRIQE